jgi:hypothetical protein
LRILPSPRFGGLTRVKIRTAENFAAPKTKQQKGSPCGLP